MREYTGQCSCGAINLMLLSRLVPEEFQPRSDAQACHFCEQHKGVWISDSEGSLITHESNVTDIKRFASEQVQFHFCVKCRELTYATYHDVSSGKEVAVFRRDLFDQIAPLAQPVLFTIFEGETIASGRERRLTNWTPVSRMSY